jgi:hypothetical protein
MPAPLTPPMQRMLFTAVAQAIEAKFNDAYSQEMCAGAMCNVRTLRALARRGLLVEVAGVLESYRLTPEGWLAAAFFVEDLCRMHIRAAEDRLKSWPDSPGFKAISYRQAGAAHQVLAMLATLRR